MFEDVDEAWKKARASSLLFLVAALLAQAQVPGMAEEEPDIPDWINEINPADYVLLDSDLPSDLHVAGDISADARAAEMAVMRDGNADVERFAFVEVHENICQRDPEGVYDCIGGNYLLSVYVYETTDLAKAVWENTIVEQYGELPPPEGFDYVVNIIAPVDSRFGGEGRCIGPYIWYKNILCTIFGSVDENGNKIGSLWLDKVSNAEPPVQVNLKMEEEGLSLVMGYVYHGSFIGTENYRPLQEKAADQQAIQAQVFNVGNEVAENVYIQFYLQMPGEAEYSKLGEPLLAGDVPPREGRAVYTYWDLKGENVEGAVIGAQAYVPGAIDVNPDDNFIAITVNVYYAFNGDRAYSAEDDAYSFENYDFNESKTEEMAEELIATVAAGVPQSIETDMWLRLFFPQTYVRLWDYFNESYRSGAGGHCYGMAATSALYFTDPSLRPAAKMTSKMSKDEASQNIDIYHRAQMIPLVRSLLADESPYFEKSWATSSYDSQYNTYTKVKRSLKEDRTPLIIEFGGPKNGPSYNQHAVLAYKLVEIEGEPYKQVYIYDSNTLMSDLEKFKKPMPVVLLWLHTFFIYSVQSGVQLYPWIEPRYIDANPVWRTIPLEEANALLPGLKEMAKSWIETLKNEGKFAAVTRRPADALFTDSSGRRVGADNGRVVNEIPGAEVMSSGEVEIYLLPADGKYSISVVGTGSGEMGLDIIRPDGENSASLVSFQKISIDSGTEVSGELDKGGAIQMLQSEGDIMQPTLTGSLDLTGFDKAAPKELISISDKLLYSDDFSDPNSGWLRASNNPDLSAMGYENGRYHILEKKPGHQAWSSPLNSPTLSDFAAEVEATQEDGPNNNGYGFVMRRDTAGNAYNFIISGNGNYRFDKLVGEKWTEIIPWTWSSSIKTGPTTNIIRIEGTGDKFTFYVNGAKIGEAQDSTIPSGRIGLVVGAYDDDPNAHISFDNLRIWALGQG